MNLSRKKFMFSFIMSMIDMRSVQFSEIATKLNEESKADSNMRRIQSFFENYELDYERFAVLWMNLCPARKLTICIDRTNWKFGGQNINILFLTVHYQGVGIPILLELLDKRGNSNQEERINLLNRFSELFGTNRIEKITGDREFIGEKWLSWLQENNIPFVMRTPKSHLICLKDSLIGQKPEELLMGKKSAFYKNVVVNGVHTNVAIKRLEDGELLTLIGTGESKSSLQDSYRQRWSIETFFQSIKIRGFDLESTHLQDIYKLKKLIALTATAYLFCLQIGLSKHKYIKTIPTKNHGYKAKSFFRYGLDAWRAVTSFIKERVEQLEQFFQILLQFLTKYSVKKFV